MDRSTLEHFEKQLTAMEADLLASMETRTEAAAPVQLDTAIGRLSRMDAILSQQMALGMKARQQQALNRVRNALQAVRNGTYGQCRRCRAPIAIERLEAQPDAVLCVTCASQTPR
jgi:DnaK suppressor protein